MLFRKPTKEKNIKLAKTVLEATLTVARLACQSWGNVMANLTLKSTPQFRDSEDQHECFTI